jgi:hypothetical protein
MELGPRYLGFALPYDLMWRQGARDRTANRGVCPECGKHRENVYLRGDGTLYCRFCIHFDLASVRILTDEPHVPAFPIETVWERVAPTGLHDDFSKRLDFWTRALG